MTDGLARVEFCDWCDKRQFADESEMIGVINNVHICENCAAELAFDSLQGSETMTSLRRTLQAEKNAGHNVRRPSEGHTSRRTPNHDKMDE